MSLQPSDSDPSITVDDTRFPVVDVTFRGTSTDDEFRAYLERMSDVATRGRKNVVIIDARASGSTSATQRKLQAEWLDQHRAELRAHSLGTAFVITSPWVRGILTAILWLTPMPSAHVVVKTLAEAEGWASERLREAGVEVPAGLRA